MNARTPEISVVAATHDRSTRLQALLDSLRRQTVGPGGFEVIVVDDASSDETPAVLRDEVERGELRLTTIRRDSSRGPAVARNEGWRAALAPVVAFVDDDCVVADGWLEEGLRCCRENATAIVQGKVDPLPEEAHLETPFTRTLRIHAAGPYYQTCNIFYPRALLEALGGFDETYTMPGGEDTDLAWRGIARGAPTVFCVDAQAYHAVNQIGALGRLRVASHWYESLQVYKHHPELRQAVFLKGIFWKPWHYTFFRALLALAVPRRFRWLRLWLTLPYVASIETRIRFEGGTALHAAFYPIEDVVEIAAAIRASVLYRMLVL
jgi:glycosyltransferase involved in cell wall biosynthesis